MDRKTFAVISHPDAGKTTLTEKFLLFGGAIKTAGAVKNNKIKTSAASDFMEIEKQRGISVATSVMGFEYQNSRINLLDTPGHKDFAEDTYRTLTAVDSVILVIDCVKGVEEQTRKLMEVCRMRNTPVMVFINKMDRPGKDPFDLLDELEADLSINVCPLSWPVYVGFDFKGVYDIYNKQLNLFQPNKTGIETEKVEIVDINGPNATEYLGRNAPQLHSDINLIKGVYNALDAQAYRNGDVAPVFFGSALNNFGVKELLDAFVRLAPLPQPRNTTEEPVDPTAESFSGFVFKIHANLDPNHRDRIAFLRICSGKFLRNRFYHHVRLNKRIRFSSPTTFMAQEKSVVTEAYPGDVVGLYDNGSFKIGDTLTEGKSFLFKGIPSFSPEILKEVINTNPIKTKQLDKGIRQLTDEGVAQLFIKQPGNRKMIGTVGELQYEVIQYRLLHEYGASCQFSPIPIYKLCWLSSKSQPLLGSFMDRKAGNIVTDRDNNPVFIAKSRGELDALMGQYREIRFSFISESLIKNEPIDPEEKIFQT